LTEFRSFIAGVAAAALTSTTAGTEAPREPASTPTTTAQQRQQLDQIFLTDATKKELGARLIDFLSRHYTRSEQERLLLTSSADITSTGARRNLQAAAMQNGFGDPTLADSLGRREANMVLGSFASTTLLSDDRSANHLHTTTAVNPANTFRLHSGLPPAASVHVTGSHQDWVAIGALHELYHVNAGHNRAIPGQQPELVPPHELTSDHSASILYTKAHQEGLVTDPRVILQHQAARALGVFTIPDMTPGHQIAVLQKIDDVQNLGASDANGKNLRDQAFREFVDMRGRLYEATIQQHQPEVHSRMKKTVLDDLSRRNPSEAHVNSANYRTDMNFYATMHYSGQRFKLMPGPLAAAQTLQNNPEVTALPYGSRALNSFIEAAATYTPDFFKNWDKSLNSTNQINGIHRLQESLGSDTKPASPPPPVKRPEPS
jgi:hypothetical protein